MPRSIVDLSVELQVQVIEELLRHEHEIHLQASSAFNAAEHHVFEYHRDLMSWSCTSSYYRNLLAPYIFKSVRLSNLGASATSIRYLLEGDYKSLIREIYFVGEVPPPAEEDLDVALSEGFFHESDEEPESLEVTLPATIECLLCDLTQFPSLEALSMGFIYPYHNCWVEVNDYADEEDGSADKWRSLMANTYKALCHKKSPQIKTFEIRQLLWPGLEHFRTPCFQDFLSRIENFKLTVEGRNSDDSGDYWCEAYVNCIQSIDELFLAHLRSAKTLTMKGPDEEPIGRGASPNSARLILGKDSMPLLRKMALEKVFICEELADFIQAHSNTLEEINLYECLSSRTDPEVDVEPSPYPWVTFFKDLKTPALKKIRQLRIDHAQVPLGSGERAAEIQRLLMENPARRLFPYAYVEDQNEYSSLNPNEEENVAAFLRGEDQAAFDSLMYQISTKN